MINNKLVLGESCMTAPSVHPRSGFEWAPIPDAPFGVEVDVDLRTGLGADEREALRQLFRRDGLVLFRNQSLTMDEQLDACSIFGPVMRGSRENYIVSNVHKDGLLGNRELLFHNDVPYVPAPYLGGSLHALEVDDGVSATRFASGFRAWERLPAELQYRIDGLNALHIKGRAIGQRTRMTDLSPGDNCAVHALVGRQKETGRRYIFACVEMTGLLLGLPEEQGEALLQELFSYLYADDGVYEHHWRQGDLIIWDNLAVQHARSRIAGGTRTLQRVTIAEYGYWDQYPVDLPTYDALHENRTA
jgi:taurine dioxygenase